MIWVPASRSCFGVSPFTVAFVPQKMKAGVSTSPCGVFSRPQRAAVSPEGSREGGREGGRREAT